jgi:hypothetical protein
VFVLVLLHDVLLRTIGIHAPIVAKGLKLILPRHAWYICDLARFDADERYVL